jgi:hypothetical protein
MVCLGVDEVGVSSDFEPLAMAKMAEDERSDLLKCMSLEGIKLSQWKVGPKPLGTKEKFIPGAGRYHLCIL